ncbi:response regulator transcription factor [Bacillus horti]|uniref:NarL family two-component system response regulator LiaR n=1 Tax=Caldalkalibacillus horti TaxID=77523 RepID=A0ABT9VUS4_9BACI|nr:response regulator transcription factor [Bacillus horti]MDQ0164743.1 NarL family two-component system response regulator LiaR [Bacillus horti]
MDRIKVLVVEDDSDWTAKLMKWLVQENDIQVVGRATTREQAVQLAKTIHIHIILMDINLSVNKLDSIYATLEIAKACPAKMIMLTSCIDEELIERAFIVGAAHFISKSKYKQLPQIIREVHYETTPVEIIMRKYRILKKEEQLNILTPAEKEVYELVEQGYTRSQIEQKLSKTRNTVKNQIKNILKKLGGSTLKEAIANIEMRCLFTPDILNKKRNSDKVNL